MDTFEIITILVVDDEERICSKIKNGLERLSDNYNIFTANSGMEALTQIENEMFDIMITDIRMPGMDGIELLKKAKDLNDDLQTIILTGHGDLNNAIEALRLGATNYIKKPVSFEVLHYTIEKAYEKLQLIRQLRDSEEQFRSSFYIAATGMIIVQPNGKISQVNHYFAQLVGYKREELLQFNVRELIHGDDTSDFMDNLEELILGNEDQFQLEMRFRRQDESIIWTNVSCSTLREDQVPVFLIIQVLDITHRKNMEDKLRYFSIHDSLTGLYNRTFFEAEVARLERGRHNQIGVIIADLDKLKTVNDSYGHSAGDEYIRTAGEILRASFRADDAVCRVGGDEYAVLLPGAPREVAQRSIDRVNELLEQQPLRISETPDPIYMQISFGIAIWEGKGSLQDAIKLADKRMYDNKFSRKAHLDSKTGGKGSAPDEKDKASSP